MHRILNVMKCTVISSFIHQTQKTNTDADVSTHTPANAFSISFRYTENFDCTIYDRCDGKQTSKVCKLLLLLFCIINRNASALIEKVSKSFRTRNCKKSRAKKKHTHTPTKESWSYFEWTNKRTSVSFFFHMTKYILKFYGRSEIVGINFQAANIGWIIGW